MNDIPGVETQTETTIIDYWTMGEAHLAQASDDEQGNLICGFAAGLRALGGDVAGRQIEYIARFINDDPEAAHRGDLVWFLRELLARLEEA